MDWMQFFKSKFLGRIIFNGSLTSIVFSLFSCGKNEGYPSDSSHKNPGLAACRPGDESEKSVSADQYVTNVSDHQKWTVGLRWTSSQKLDPNVPLELSGLLLFRSLNGNVPKSISNVKIIATLPRLMQSTGGLDARGFVLDCIPGTYGFDRIFVTFAGRWQVRILATIDDVADQLDTFVDVVPK